MVGVDVWFAGPECGASEEEEDGGQECERGEHGKDDAGCCDGCEDPVGFEVGEQEA